MTASGRAHSRSGTSERSQKRSREDARERGARLRARVSDAVDRVLSETAHPLGDVYVGWIAAADVATCPLRYRADGQHGWGFPGWSPMLAAGAVGRAALTHHLRAHGQADVLRSEKDPLPPPDPASAVREWMRAASRGESRPPVGGWVAELTAARGPEERALLAATAAYAGRWLGGFVRVMGWPLPPEIAIAAGDMDNPLSLRWAKNYRIRQEDSCVTIASSPDALWGRISPAGDHWLVVHRPTSRSDTEVSNRAAFEAVAATLTTGVTPAKVVLTTGDTGEKLHLATDDALLDRGVESMVEVVRQRDLATSDARPQDPEGSTPRSELTATPPAELDGPDAKPSPACHHCDHLEHCGPGQTWLKGPGRWLAGLPVASP